MSWTVTSSRDMTRTQTRVSVTESACWVSPCWVSPYWVSPYWVSPYWVNPYWVSMLYMPSTLSGRHCS